MSIYFKLIGDGYESTWYTRDSQIPVRNRWFRTLLARLTRKLFVLDYHASNLGLALPGAWKTRSRRWYQSLYRLWKNKYWRTSSWFINVLIVFETINLLTTFIYYKQHVISCMYILYRYTYILFRAGIFSICKTPS
jgi:hypothetical protein